MDTITLIKNLERPISSIDVILDTDAYNEIDDQFAIAYMLANRQKLNVKAIFAAPFYNGRSTGPKDGMEKSYDEIKKVLSLIGGTASIDVCKGSDGTCRTKKRPLFRLRRNISRSSPCSTARSVRYMSPPSAQSQI